MKHWHQIQRVKRGPSSVPPILPKDTWREHVFVEADGTELIVMYSGKYMPSVHLMRASQPSYRTIGHPVVRS